MGIVAMVLAAGASRRFGAADKLLADAGDGVPVAARVLDALGRAGVATIVVVVRPGADRLVEALRAHVTSRALRFVDNAGANLGLASSIAAGLAHVPADASGLLVTPADLPGLTVSTVERLLTAYDADGCGRIAYAALPDGSQRNPVVWPPRLWPGLAGLSGDVGGKALIEEDAIVHGAVVVRVADAAELSDIDTPGDLRRFTARDSR